MNGYYVATDVDALRHLKDSALRQLLRDTSDSSRIVRNSLEDGRMAIQGELFSDLRQQYFTSLGMLADTVDHTAEYLDKLVVAFNLVIQRAIETEEAACTELDSIWDAELTGVGA